MQLSVFSRFFIASALSFLAAPGLTNAQELLKKDELNAPTPADTTADQNSIRRMIREELGAIEAAGQRPFSLNIEGYGDMRFAYYDYPESITQEEGSRGDSRTGFDITRFTAEIEGKHNPSGIEFEAEVEFEHGGTGSSVELEQDEFGEFENEVEKGGEVNLEELWLKKDFGSGWTGRVGRFYLAVGLLSPYHLPTDYLATGRSEAETTVIPGVWDEVGFELTKQFESSELTLQLVNGLDSTGFSASQWVSSGHQDRFEGVRAEDVAVVVRYDINALPGLVTGGSFYGGGSSGNRPKDDLDADGTVTIYDLHYHYRRDRFRSQGMVLYGHLDDAEEISKVNARLPNSLEVARTAVADGAWASWIEAGYDIGPWVGTPEGQTLEPFIRVDYYDTYFDTRDELADNGRYERTVLTAGLAYTFNDSITAKLDVTNRFFGEDDIDDQTMVRLGFGLVY